MRDLQAFFAGVEEGSKSPAEVAEFLSGLSSTEEISGPRLVPFWPLALDDLVVVAYAEDPEPFDERWESFADSIRDGFKLVLRRFGKLEDQDLPENSLQALATQLIEGGFPKEVFLLRQNKPERVELSWESNSSDCREFVALFAPRPFSPPQGNYHRDGALQDWRKVVLTMEGLPSEYADLAVKLSEEGAKKGAALLDDGNYSPAHLLEMARRFMATINQWDRAIAELCMAVAVVELDRVGEHIPEGIEELISCSLLGYAAAGDEAFDLYGQALGAIPRERIIPRILQLVQSPHPWLYGNAFRVLQIWPQSEELLEAALAVIDRDSPEEWIRFSGTIDKLADGLGAMLAHCDEEVLTPVAKAYKRNRNAQKRDVLRRAILVALARWTEAGQGFSQKNDQFIDYVAWNKKSTTLNAYFHSILGNLNQTVKGLGAERAEKLLLAQLNSKNRQWPRALEGVQHHPTQRLIERVLELVAEHGEKTYESPYDWFVRMLQSFDDEALGPVRDGLASSDSVGLHEKVKGALGSVAYEELMDAGGAKPRPEEKAADKVDRLAKKYFAENKGAARTTIYYFEPLDEPVGAEEVNRIGGRPFGVGEATWPRKDHDPDQPMEHMFTIDLNDLRELGERLGNGARAVSLFVCEPGFNEAYSPYSADTRVVLLDEAAVAAGPFQGELPAGESQGRSFGIRAVEVPLAVFEGDGDAEPDDDGDDGHIESISNAVYQASARAGGAPIWLQEPEDPGSGFVLQFDETFVDINLGDSGVMYVFADTAFWQCY